MNNMNDMYDMNDIKMWGIVIIGILLTILIVIIIIYTTPDFENCLKVAIDDNMRLTRRIIAFKNAGNFTMMSNTSVGSVVCFDKDKIVLDSNYYTYCYLVNDVDRADKIEFLSFENTNLLQMPVRLISTPILKDSIQSSMRILLEQTMLKLKRFKVSEINEDMLIESDIVMNHKLKLYKLQSVNTKHNQVLMIAVCKYITITIKQQDLNLVKLATDLEIGSVYHLHR